MNREDIVRMAQETGVTAERVRDLVNFAALVIANNPPQSYMTWQEGYASGMARERERFIEVLRQLHDSYSLASDSNAIRERGQT
jgi:hypothetical protein